MTAGLPPAAKLPLTVRKNVRDEFDNKIPEFEQQYSEILKTPWKIEINPLAIYPYAQPGSYGAESLGSCLGSYVADGFYTIREYYASERYHGESGVAELNSVAFKHTITMEASTKISYCGCEIADGYLRILFNPQNLGTNIGQAFTDLKKAVNTAPQPSGASIVSYTARHAIEKDWAPKETELQASLAKLLANPNIKIDPNFKEVASKLKSSKDVGPSNWEENFGSFPLAYFGSVVDRMRREKFEDDDMLQEGFAEVIDKGIIKIRVVDKLVKATYNECVAEDGILYLQTVPKYWGTNVDNVAEKMMSVL